LMNDEDVDVMPGLGLPPPAPTTTEAVQSGETMKENVANNGSPETMKSVEPKSNGKRKAEDALSTNAASGQPPAKKMKISRNGHAATSTSIARNGVKTEIVEHPLSVHPSRMGLVGHSEATAAAKEEPINYANP